MLAFFCLMELQGEFSMKIYFRVIGIICLVSSLFGLIAIIIYGVQVLPTVAQMPTLQGAWTVISFFLGISIFILIAPSIGLLFISVQIRFSNVI